MKLNGSDYHNYYLEHGDIMKGGKIEFDMTSAPEENIKQENLPVTVINDNFIVSVPYFSTPEKTFKDNMKVEIKSLDKDTKIHYTITAMYEDEVIEYGIYEKPLVINNDCVIYALCENKYGEKSFTVSGEYHKIPDYDVKLISEYNKQYTAGGPEGLIDGIRGQKNWRLGNWQGYQGQDFEAVIDLKKVKMIRNISAGFLQDIRSWIWMPVNIYFDISEDGINFTNVAEILNDVLNNDYNSGVIIKDYSSVINKNARYVKVRAANYGKIPEWHPGFGDDAFIFIDEIIIE